MNIKPIRVIVTGNDERGQSFVVNDAPAGGAHVQPGRPTALTDVWHVPAVPADPLANGERVGNHPFTLSPQPGGVSFRMVQFDPMTDEQYKALDGSNIFASMNAATEYVRSGASPLMHRTDTVDFGLVVSGSLTMVLDQETVQVAAGDIIVQRATNHAWENRGTSPALVAFVLIDAKGETNEH